jgi:Rod binding domain-containing protein
MMRLENGAPTGSTVAVRDHAGARPGSETKRGAQAGREFEAIFVRAMLRSTPLAKGGEVYGDFVVDAVAKAVTDGRGLGMAEIIARGVGARQGAE